VSSSAVRTGPVDSAGCAFLLALQSRRSRRRMAPVSPRLVIQARPLRICVRMSMHKRQNLHQMHTSKRAQRLTKRGNGDTPYIWLRIGWDQPPQPPDCTECIVRLTAPHIAACSGRHCPPRPPPPFSHPIKSETQSETNPTAKPRATVCSQKFRMQ